MPVCGVVWEDRGEHSSSENGMCKGPGGRKQSSLKYRIYFHFISALIQQIFLLRTLNENHTVQSSVRDRKIRKLWFSVPFPVSTWLNARLIAQMVCGIGM